MPLPMPLKTIKTRPRKEKAGSSLVRRPAVRSHKSPLPLLKEEFLAMAFRLSPHPIGITELETGRCLEINDACLEIFGFRRDEVIGRMTLMLGIWPDPEARVRLIERVKAERSVRDVEVMLRTKPGDRRRFLISANLVKLGKKRCLLTIGHDITDRTQGEEALRRKSQLIDLSFEPIFVWDLDNGITEWNRGCERLYGYSRNEALGQVSHQLLRTRFAISPAEAEKALLTKGIWKGELRHVARDGREVIVESRWQLIIADEHRIVLEANRDITEHKQTEQVLQQLNATLESHVAERTAALSESEERFRAFLDHAPNLAFIKSLDGRYLYANRRFQEAFGIDQHGLVGKTDSELFSREQADQFQSNDYRVLASGEAMEFEEVARYTSGSHTNIVVKFPLRDESSRIYATGGIVTDITDRKHAEEQLRHNQEELRQHRAQLQDLASKLITAQEQERQRIARELHDDISQRMAALVLDVAALEQRPLVLPDRLADLLCPVRERLEQLSDDIHNLAYKLHPSLLEHVGLRAAVEDHLRELMNRTSLTVSYKFHRVPDSLSLDYSTGLFRVLQETLQNVLKHAKATEVSVKLRGSSKGVGLTVTDNGRGFDPQDVSVHQKGLGLINMQERLRLLGGFLRIHARPGDGTKVCAWIPLKGTTI